MKPVECIGRTSKREKIWLCRCSCGKTRKQRASRLDRPCPSCGASGQPTNQRATLAERFWAQVDKHGANGCWIWTGPTDTGGYAKIKVNRRNVKAHRTAYELHVGPIPEGLDLCHSCDNRLCVNPAHLWPGTRRENILDAQAKGRLSGPSSPAGEDCNASKLTTAQVVEIRRLAAAGMRPSEIARQFSTCPQNVRSIVMRRTWKNVAA